MSNFLANDILAVTIYKSPHHYHLFTLWILVKITFPGLGASILECTSFREAGCYTSLVSYCNLVLRALGPGRTPCHGAGHCTHGPKYTGLLDLDQRCHRGREGERSYTWVTQGCVSSGWGISLSPIESYRDQQTGSAIKNVIKETWIWDIITENLEKAKRLLSNLYHWFDAELRTQHSHTILTI